MTTFDALSDMCLRQMIDAGSLYREVLRVQRELALSSNGDWMGRLKSLQKVLDETERVNKALRLGCVSEKVLKLLNQWELAGQVQIVLGFEALHVYAGLACVRIKKSSPSKFDWAEHREAQSLLKMAVESGAIQSNKTDQVVFARSGRMGLMHVLGPLSFIQFKNWLLTQPRRSIKQRRQDQLQIDVVEELIEQGLLSATFDQY